MNHEMHRTEPGTPKKYPMIQGTPVEDGWMKVGNYYTKELPTGGIQKLTAEEWEKKNKYSGLRKTVGKGLELQALENQRAATEKLRQAALRSAREALTKEFEKLEPRGKETNQ